MPLQVFRPVWADDEHFEITYHVRHAAVPAPGGPEQLRALAARPAGMVFGCIGREQNGHRESPPAVPGAAASVHKCSARLPSSWRRTAMVKTVPPQAVQTYWRSPLT